MNEDRLDEALVWEAITALTDESVTVSSYLKLKDKLNKKEHHKFNQYVDMINKMEKDN